MPGDPHICSFTTVTMLASRQDTLGATRAKCNSTLVFVPIYFVKALHGPYIHEVGFSAPCISGFRHGVAPRALRGCRLGACSS